MTFPLLLSVPHAGLTVPPEVSGICMLSEDAIVKDGDEGAAEIYLPMREQVEAFVTTDIARAIVDMNRAESDRRKDGVVKTHTCWEVPIYRGPLSQDLIEQLLQRYHRPYHQRLELLAGNVIAGIDCHTMAAVGPPVSPDAGKPRPSVCLSNASGTCPHTWLGSLAEIIEKTMETSVSINAPFQGGYIIRHHAGSVPWFQLELSRASFLSHHEKSARILESLRKWLKRLL